MARKKRKRVRDPHRGQSRSRGEKTQWWLVAVVVVLVIAFLVRRLGATVI